MQRGGFQPSTSGPCGGHPSAILQPTADPTPADLAPSASSSSFADLDTASLRRALVRADILGQGGGQPILRPRAPHSTPRRAGGGPIGQPSWLVASRRFFHHPGPPPYEPPLDEGIFKGADRISPNKPTKSTYVLPCQFYRFLMRIFFCSVQFSTHSSNFVSSHN